MRQMAPEDPRNARTVQPSPCRISSASGPANQWTSLSSRPCLPLCDTDAPGACVSATIWRFNASEYCRRFVAPACLVSTKPLVDKAGSGHLCSLLRHPLIIAPISAQRQALLTERLPPSCGGLSIYVAACQSML